MRLRKFARVFLTESLVYGVLDLCACPERADLEHHTFRIDGNKSGVRHSNGKAFSSQIHGKCVHVQ